MEVINVFGYVVNYTDEYKALCSLEMKRLFSTELEDVIFSKDGSDVRDVLSLFQDWCANNKDKWKKIYSICNVNNINNPSKIFDLDDLFCEFEWEL